MSSSSDASHADSDAPIDAGARGDATVSGDGGVLGSEDGGESGAMDSGTTDARSADASSEAGASGDLVDTCTASQIACDGRCANPFEVDHCGTCDNDCLRLPHIEPGSATCSIFGNRCQYTCAPGYADCDDAGNGCTTSLLDPAHCGACGASCSTGVCAPVADAGDGGSASCAASCPGALSLCQGACVDETSNDDDCGGCGASFACAGGRTCQGGQCACPAGAPDLCAGSCTNLQSDPANCGACGHDCAGGHCDAGRCGAVQIASVPTGQGQAIAVGAGHVFVSSAWQIVRVPIGAGTPLTMVPSVNLFGWISVSGGQVYYFDSSVQGGGAGYPTRLMSISVNGGAPVIAASTLTSHIYTPVVSGGDLYWVDKDGSADPVARVEALQLDVPSTPAQLAEGPSYYPMALAPTASAIYMSYDGPLVDGGAIVDLPLDGGSAVVLASGISPGSIAANATDLYWADERIAGSVYRLPLDGGQSRLVGMTDGGPYDLLLTPTNAYWLDPGLGLTSTGSILGAPLDGGSEWVLASSQDDPQSLVSDGASLYWVTFDGKLMRLVLP